MTESAIRDAIEVALAGMGVESADIRLERPKDPAHGDLATNVALTLASVLKRPPRAIAEEIAERLDLDAAGVQAVEIAGPGFLNFRRDQRRVAAVLHDVMVAGTGYGRTDVGEGRPIMVEFVSANPTGPLHIGHARQAALGDAIAGLLEWTGWSVSREYYYNDTGVQIDRLADSMWARYQQSLGNEAELPEGGYHGDYVVELANQFVDQVGDRYAGEATPEALDALRVFAVAKLREEQDRDLGELGVRFDTYFLESSLYDSGRVDSTVADLRATGLVYDHDGAVWLKTTEFGDQKDRVMLKSDGAPTYFLPDVAYHLDKWGRGFEHVINVQGSDHHGTVARVRAGLQALGLPRGYPEYVLHQMVRVEKDGEEVKFSKRSGFTVTLRELFEQVGVDVTRYLFQWRKPEAQLVFDLDLALDQSEKNPVYKIQYAHARMCSIFRKAGVDLEDSDVAGADLTLLTHPTELELIKRLTDLPDLIERAAELRAPHLVCDYLEQLAGAVNSWYHAGNPSRNPELAVLVDNPELSRARLALTRSVQIVLANGLSVLGISAPERMERKEAR